jgi:hypothetical protein
MHYTVYKVTNNINGMFYIGAHKTKDVNDDYMGSGKYLKRSQNKHGIGNFTKEILFTYDNPEEMYAKEAEIVNEEFIAEENTYNLKVGGSGGFDYVQLLWQDDDYRARMSTIMKLQHAKNTRPKCSPHITGKFKHSDESKQKMSRVKEGCGVGGSNANAKRVEDENGYIFSSLKECAASKDIHYDTVSRRIQNGTYKVVSSTPQI